MKKLEKESVVKYYKCDKDKIITNTHIAFEIDDGCKILKSYDDLDKLNNLDVKKIDLNDLRKEIKDDKLFKKVLNNYVVDVKNNNNNKNENYSELERVKHNIKNRNLIILSIEKKRIIKKIEDLNKNNNSFVISAVNNLIKNIKNNKIKIENIKILDRVDESQKEFEYFSDLNYMCCKCELCNYFTEHMNIYLDNVVHDMLFSKIEYENYLEDLKILMEVI